MRSQSTEQDYFRRANEQQLIKFEQKFTEFQSELTHLNDENYRLREKEKRSKKQAQELDIELTAWKEKHKYLEERTREMQFKYETVSRDMQTLAHENERQMMLNAIQERQDHRKAERSDEAIDDIKNLIKSFKNQRAGLKENVSANLGDTTRSQSPRRFAYMHK